MKSKITSSIAISIVMVIGYVLSFLKESLIANFFGISQDVDSYTIAIQIPVVLFALVAVSIRSFVIPIYSNCLYNEGTESANQYISNLSGVMYIITILFVICIELFADYVIYCFAPGFSSNGHEIAVNLLRITVPSIIFVAQNDIFTAILNVNKKYIFTSFAVYVLNICIIFCIIILHSRWGIFSAVIGQILGSVFQLLYILFLSRKVFSYKPILKFRDSKIKESSKMSVPIIWSTCLAEINSMVNKIVASSLLVGSIAALNYSSKLNSIFIALISNIISVVLYPYYAELVAKKNFKQMNDVCNFSFGVFLMAVLPLIAILLILKREIIEMAFARGMFDTNAVNVTQKVFTYYTIGLLFITFRAPLTQIFYALKNTKIPAKNATYGIILNIILNLTLPHFMGIEGLALSSSISAAFVAINLFIKLLKQDSGFRMDYFYRSSWKILLSSIIMMIIVLILKFQININNTYLKVTLCSLLGTAIYVCLLWLCRTQVLLNLVTVFPFKRYDKNSNKR